MELWNQDTMNAPWGVTSRTTLAAWAVRFFNPMNYADSYNAIGKHPNEKPELFSLTEFIKYLENKKAFAKKPNIFVSVKFYKRCLLLAYFIILEASQTSWGSFPTPIFF